VRRILAEDGIEPAPERRKHMPWATFLKAHWGAIAAKDFFKSVSTASSRWVRRERLGSLINDYDREAACIPGDPVKEHNGVDSPKKVG
jgi:hypothetical protein